MVSICKDFGFRRVQKSVFLGKVSRNEAEMMFIKFREVLKGAADYLFLIPSCEKCFESRMLIGQIEREIIDEPSFLLIGGDHD